jgi:mitogen-activated protein kinase kinase kinase 6
MTDPFPRYCLQVLVLEINKVLLPARLEIQGTDPVSTVTLSLLDPETQVSSETHYSPIHLSFSSPL